jgi:hypothetical protein
MSIRLPMSTIVLVLVLALSPQSGSSAEGDSHADSAAVRFSRYEQLISDADSLYQVEEYVSSADRYAAAFENVRRPAASDLYNAACSAALAGQVGRSFGFLHRAIEAGWENLGHMDADPDLAPLRAYGELWAEAHAAVRRTMKARYGDSFDPELAAELSEIYARDQGIRHELKALEEAHGYPLPDSIGVPFMQRWEKIDSENLARLEKIVEEHGWPGRSRVGRQGASAAFLVVQHAPLEVQERYLPLLEAAVAAREAQPSQLALLTDRILTRNGKPQRYGSQLHRSPETGKVEFLPIEDPANVNARRAAVGLEPIEEYARRFGIEYEAPPAER